MYWSILIRNSLSGFSNTLGSSSTSLNCWAARRCRQPQDAQTSAQGCDPPRYNACLLRTRRSDSASRAAELSRTPLAAFTNFAAAHEVSPIRYGATEVEEDRRTLAELGFVTVVSNSSPLISLAKIKSFHPLRQLFGTLVISAEVYAEVVVLGAGTSLTSHQILPAQAPPFPPSPPLARPASCETRRSAGEHG